MSSREKAPDDRGAERRSPAAVHPPLRIQAKLVVGAADDPLEHEADRAADAFVRWRGRGVLASPVDAGALVRSARVRRAAGADALGSFAASPDVERRIAAARGRGDQLADTDRARYESFFGADLSGVRVHRGTEAAELNRAVSARAFTVGSDVFLGAGEGGGGEGQRLMAHELAHVVQQTGAAQRSVVRRDPTKPGGKVGGKQGASATTGTAGDMTETISELTDPGVAATTTGASKVDDAGKGSSALALGAGLLGLWAAIGRLKKLMATKNNAGEELIFEAIEDVAAAGTTVKGSLAVAQAATGALAATVVPGMDLAVSSVMALTHVGRIVQIKSSMMSQRSLVASLRDRVATDANARVPLAAALTLLGETRKALNVNLTRFVGDLLLIAGSAVSLTGVGGPLGNALKLIGGSIEVLAGLGNWIAESARVDDTYEARDRFDKAEAALAANGGAAEKKEMADATAHRAANDVAFAVDQLFGLLVGHKLGDEEAEALKGTFAGFGIGPKWLARFESTKELQDAEAGEARATVLGVLGAAENPKTIGQKIIGGIKALGAAIKRKLFGEKDEAGEVRQEAEIRADLWIDRYAQGRLADGGRVSAADVTGRLKPIRLQLLAERSEKQLGADKARACSAAVDAAFTVVVARHLKGLGLDDGSLTVVDGVVSFTDFDPPQPVPAADPAKTPALAGASA